MPESVMVFVELALSQVFPEVLKGVVERKGVRIAEVRPPVKIQVVRDDHAIVRVESEADFNACGRDVGER